MIKEIQFVKYKKLNNITLSFKEGINAISGENGTCKSSLLYLISNSFQAVTPKCSWIREPSALGIIRAVNMVTNPKIESLQRKEYSNPAPEVQGTLYTVSYYDHDSLEFRRHNSRTQDKSRYALKPYYKEKGGDKLPYCPVLYLGLSRLIPYGEYINDEAVSSIKKNLPAEFIETVAKNYKDFTGFDITHKALQKMGDIKSRSEFISDVAGIDSNTISAGEDNLYIILAALESLKCYYEAIDSARDIESVLLIDELDATLHPDYQFRLLKLMRNYAQKYKIQIFFTTHSITALEDLLLHHDNVIYLVDNVSHVTPMELPTIQQIKAHLYNLTADDIYRDKCIPIFTEDPEARLLIELLFDYFEEQESTKEFCKVRRFFQIPDINISADILRSLFKDEKLIKSQVGAFCILDGDQNKDLTNCIITLPGKNAFKATQGLAPEKLLFDYAQHLYDSDDKFWDNPEVIRQGFSKIKFQRSIIKEIQKYEEAVANNTASEKPREFNKKLFNKNKKLFEYVFKRWLHDDDNAPIITIFYSDLRTMFLKCADLRGINPGEWK